jgi:hypothetical protein
MRVEDVRPHGALFAFTLPLEDLPNEEMNKEEEALASREDDRG